MVETTVPAVHCWMGVFSTVVPAMKEGVWDRGAVLGGEEGRGDDIFVV